MIGEKLGKYTILEIVGSGSMGTVYKAEDPEGRLVALKLVRSQILYDLERRERFLQCVFAASQIHHKGICPILEIGDDNDDFFVVMPFLDGRTLDQFMERKPLPWPQASHIALAVGAALAAIHEAGAVHRGLKPANIWILNSRDRTVILSDCGIARFTEMTRRGRIRSFSLGTDCADTLIPLGALAYMSPEQVRGEAVDCRSDIFSFGVVFYEMLSGRHPFEARNSLSRISAILEAEPSLPASKLTPVPPKLESIVHKALAKAREDRYQSMNDALADLKEVQDYSPANTAGMEPPARFRKFMPSLLWRRVRY